MYHACNIGDTEYTVETLQLNFIAGMNSVACTAISVLDDSALEDDEQLSLFISTNVIHSSQPAIVTIIDNDGKFKKKTF